MVTPERLTRDPVDTSRGSVDVSGSGISARIDAVYATPFEFHSPMEPHATTAEWDGDTPPYMRQTLFPLLVHAPGKRYVELPEGTHTIMMEKNRLMLFEAVQAFLDEAGRS